MTNKKIIYKVFLFLLFFGFFHSNIYSQTIKLIDNETKNFVSGALVKLYQLDSDLITKTDNKFKKRQYSNNGLVYFDTTNPFRLNISHISYETLDTIIDTYNDTITLLIKKSKTPLDEVVVTAQIGEESVYKSVNRFIILSKKKIQEYASNNLVDLLNTQALFDIQIDPTLGSGLSIQGMNGNNVNILDGCIIGKKGFGFFPNQKKNIRYPHIGIVIINDNCEIGCGSTIDRGSLSNTIIGKNTYLDNQVHIAHNNKIGDNCIIAGQVGFAGSSTLGNNVMIGGQAGVSGHLKVGNNVQIGGGSGVINDIPDNTKVMGYPAKNLREFIKDNR